MMISKPGDTIKECIEQKGEILFSLDFVLSIVKLYEKNSELYLHRLISGEQEINERTAAMLQRIFNIDAQFWLNRELAYRSKLAMLNEFNTVIEGHIVTHKVSNTEYSKHITQALKQLQIEINAD